jgi:hypothetical protein
MRYLFNFLQLIEPILGTHDNFGAALSQKAGTGAQATCGGPGAGAAGTRGGPGAGRQEPKPQGHVTTPELP